MFSIEAGLLLKGSCICVPLELLNHTLNDLHKGHQGIEKMQTQERETVNWPGIDADIADYVH